MNKDVTISLPHFEGYVYTGEFRPPKEGEKFLHYQCSQAVLTANNDFESGNSRIILKPIKKLDIPWDYIKPEYKWAWVIKSGGVVFGTTKPMWDSGICDWVSRNKGYMEPFFMSIDTDGIPYEHSLTERP